LNRKKKAKTPEEEQKKKKDPMSELSELVKSLLTKSMTGANSAFNAGGKPTKDDREKFRLQEEKIKSEELQKKMDAMKEQHEAELKLADIDKSNSAAALQAQIE
jgi:hypothetical protein